MGRPLEEAEVRRWHDLEFRALMLKYDAALAREAELEARVLAQARVIDAARDPFLVILEQIPEVENKTPNPYVNQEMKRAADRFRAALAALAETETPPEEEL